MFTITVKRAGKQTLNYETDGGSLADFVKNKLFEDPNKLVALIGGKQPVDNMDNYQITEDLSVTFTANAAAG